MVYSRPQRADTLTPSLGVRRPARSAAGGDRGAVAGVDHRHHEVVLGGVDHRRAHGELLSCPYTGAIMTTLLVVRV